MEAVAAGKGRKPKPFMGQGGTVETDAVWDSRMGHAAEEREAKGRGTKKAGAVCAPKLPEFIAPQLTAPDDAAADVLAKL
jgi:bifunctional non-homologous end joining protein LigD